MTRLFTILTLGFALTACGTIDNIGDCHAICDRYHTCYDDTYSVSSCYDRCRSNSEKSANFQRDVDVCHSCINGRNCTAAAFNCANECIGIVP